MGRAQDRVGGGQPGARAGACHPEAGTAVERVVHAAGQVDADEGHCRQGVLVGEEARCPADVGLDAVGQHVEPGRRRQPVRHGDEQARIGQRDVRHERLANESGLDATRRVGHDGELRDAGAGAGRCGCRHQRRDSPWPGPSACVLLSSAGNASPVSGCTASSRPSAGGGAERGLVRASTWHLPSRRRGPHEEVTDGGQDWLDTMRSSWRVDHSCRCRARAHAAPCRVRPSGAMPVS